MKLLDRDKLLTAMTGRKDVLYSQITSDFGGGLGGRLYSHNELKYWKEAIERGEFDLESGGGMYIILSETHPEIVDFTFYVSEKMAADRVRELNELVGKREYRYVTVYENHREMVDEGVSN